MKRPATIAVFASLVLHLDPASAQLVEAECADSWPGFPFPEALYLGGIRYESFDSAWKKYAAGDAVRAGRPPAPAPGIRTPAWIYHADLSAIAHSSDLGVFLSRFTQVPRTWGRGVTDGFIVTAWAYVELNKPKVIGNTWLYLKNDQRPVRSQCGLQVRAVPPYLWSSAPRADDVPDVAAAVPPPPALRAADNALIAEATCRERWPPIIAAAGEEHGRFLLPEVGEVIGGASLRAIRDELADEPVRWKRQKFLASRDGKLGLSIGRLVNCDDENAVQTYVSAWVRDGTAWRLELLAIVP